MNLKEFKNIIKTLFIFISLNYYLKLDCFNIMSLFIIIPIYIFIKKYNYTINKISRITSLIFSIFYNVGYICELNISSKKNIFIDIFSIKNLVMFIGLYFIILYIVSFILKILDNAKFTSNNNFNNNKKLFLVSFIFIIILGIPYFLATYPGLIAPDSIYQIKQFSHLEVLTDHHPVIHTMFLKVCFKIGSLFSNDINVKSAFATIIQMLIMTAIYSYFIVFLNTQKINKKIIIILILIFGLLPVYVFYSLSMWKDVLFGGFFLIFIISIYNIINNKKIAIKNYIVFIISALLMLLFRNNCLYMFVLFIPIYLFHFRKKIIPHIISFVVIFAIFFTIKYPIYNYFNIERSKSWEYLGMPIQQVGRMAYKDVKFTKEETKKIENFIKISHLKEDYDPRYSDGIKFSKRLNQPYFESHNKEFLLLWKDLIIKHFDIAVESYLVSTLGYWYPNIENKAVELGVTKNDINIYNKSLLPKKATNFINKLYNYDTPFLCLEWNLGLVIWLIGLCGIICFKKDKKYILCYIPAIGMLATLLLASPVNGMLRYIFWAYTTLPFYMLINSCIKKHN